VASGVRDSDGYSLRRRTVHRDLDLGGRQRRARVRRCRSHAPAAPSARTVSEAFRALIDAMANCGSCDAGSGTTIVRSARQLLGTQRDFLNLYREFDALAVAAAVRADDILDRCFATRKCRCRNRRRPLGVMVRWR
jgi:hypothetical protein